MKGSEERPLSLEWERLYIYTTHLILPMVSLLNSVMESKSLHDLAKSWKVSPEQAARRLRRTPFVMLGTPVPQAGGDGPGGGSC